MIIQKKIHAYNMYVLIIVIIKSFPLFDQSVKVIFGFRLVVPAAVNSIGCALLITNKIISNNNDGQFTI